MIRPRAVYGLFWLLCAWGFYPFVRSLPCRGAATYKLSFQAEWTKTPSRPDGAQFSGLIGCSHNHCYQMWRPERRASLGVKTLAETGQFSQLYYEILKQINEKTALVTIRSRRNQIEAEGHVILPDTTEGGFRVDASHPLVSVITRIGSSPDWFVGVYDFDLCNRSSGAWFRERRKTLFPYDAGTNGDTRFNSGNRTTNTLQDIFRLENGPLSQWINLDRGMGYFQFTLLTSFPGPAQEHVSDETFQCPNTASPTELSYLHLLLPTIAMVFR